MSGENLNRPWSNPKPEIVFELTGLRETDYGDQRSSPSKAAASSPWSTEAKDRRARTCVFAQPAGSGASSSAPTGRLKVSVITGDVRKMHRSPEYAGALFQVASQFNLLEMVSPTITPEDGVTRYQHDKTSRCSPAP